MNFCAGCDYFEPSDEKGVCHLHPPGLAWNGSDWVQRRPHVGADDRGCFHFRAASPPATAVNLATVITPES